MHSLTDNAIDVLSRRRTCRFQSCRDSYRRPAGNWTSRVKVLVTPGVTPGGVAPACSASSSKNRLRSLLQYARRASVPHLFRHPPLFLAVARRNRLHGGESGRWASWQPCGCGFGMCAGEARCLQRKLQSAHAKLYTGRVLQRPAVLRTVRRRECLQASARRAPRGSVVLGGVQRQCAGANGFLLLVGRPEPAPPPFGRGRRRGGPSACPIPIPIPSAGPSPSALAGPSAGGGGVHPARQLHDGDREHQERPRSHAPAYQRIGGEAHSSATLFTLSSSPSSTAVLLDLLVLGLRLRLVRLRKGAV